MFGFGGRRRRNEPRVVQAPMTVDELRLITMAEAEMPKHEIAEPINDDTMPAGMFFPRLRNRGGGYFKPISQDGTIGGRAVDDANAALEENRLRAMREPRED